MPTMGRQLQGVALCVFSCEELTDCSLPFTYIMPDLLLLVLLLLMVLLLLLL